MVACGRLSSKKRETQVQQGLQIKLHQIQNLGPKVLHSGCVWSFVREALGRVKVEF